MPKSQSKKDGASTRARGQRGQRGGETAKRRQVGIQKPVHPDEALAEIVGARAQARTEMTKRIWKYIKSHNLQDPEDRRMIRPDDTLGRVLGDKDKVSMFEIAGFLNAHLRTRA
jgi:chromatin remodeling complex protein RSC6